MLCNKNIITFWSSLNGIKLSMQKKERNIIMSWGILNHVRNSIAWQQCI